jgi:hypothetical protein
MSLLSKKKPGEPVVRQPDETALPVSVIDCSLRYDLYCFDGFGSHREVRIYEDMKILGIRTFEPRQAYGSAFLTGYLEVEAQDGTRMMLSHHQIRMICQHGARPVCRIIGVNEMQPKDL